MYVSSLVYSSDMLAELTKLKDLFAQFVDSIQIEKTEKAIVRSPSSESEGLKSEPNAKSELMTLCDITDYVLSVKEEMFSIFTNEHIVRHDDTVLRRSDLLGCELYFGWSAGLNHWKPKDCCARK